MAKKLNPNQLRLAMEEQKRLEQVQITCKYKVPCIYCGRELNINSIGGEIGAHHCEVGRDMWKKSRIDQTISNRQHNMFIHGFLEAVQSYISSFGLMSTAGYILKSSGIDKKDLIRCQIENGYKSEIILPLIEQVFNSSNNS